MSPLLRTALLRYGCIVFLLTVAMLAMLAAGCTTHQSVMARPDSRTITEELLFEPFDLEILRSKCVRDAIAAYAIGVDDIVRADAMLVVDHITQEQSQILLAARREAREIKPLHHKQLNDHLTALEQSRTGALEGSLYQKLDAMKMLNLELYALSYKLFGQIQHRNR